jgi:tRNA (guanine-N7-)-methyltransferase
MGRTKGRRMEGVKKFNNFFELKYGNEFTQEWSTMFGNPNSVVLELACGYAEHGLKFAELNPDKNYVCVDIKGDRLYKGAWKAEEIELKNIAFLRTSIEQLKSCFKAETISEIWLTFPDPQLKHESKRLVTTNFLELYSFLLKKGGCVVLKTDSQTNVETCLKSVGELTNLVTLEYHIPDLSQVFKHVAKLVVSRYEKKFSELGKKIQVVCLKKL